MIELSYFTGILAIGTWMAKHLPHARIFMLIGGLIFVAVELLIIYYVHRDALRNKIPYPELWLLLGLFFNIFGLIVYLLARKNYRNFRNIQRDDSPETQTSK